MHEKSFVSQGTWALICLILWVVSWIIAEAIPVFNDLLGLTVSFPRAMRWDVVIVFLSYKKTPSMKPFFCFRTFRQSRPFMLILIRVHFLQADSRLAYPGSFGFTLTKGFGSITGGRFSSSA